MSAHGTASTAGQRSEYIGAVARAATLAAEELPPNLLDEWSRKGEKIKEILLTNMNPTSQLVTPPQPLLEFVRTVQVSGAAHFVPSEKIKKGTIDGVKIVYVDPSIEGLMKGIVEENIPAGAFRFDRLVRVAQCSEIDTALNGRFAHFSDIWDSVKLQPKGEAGALHVNGKANLFRVVVGGCAWLVYAYFGLWLGGRGWDFNAYRADGTSGWHEGRLVGSRDPAPVAI